MGGDGMTGYTTYGTETIGLRWLRKRFVDTDRILLQKWFFAKCADRLCIYKSVELNYVIRLVLEQTTQYLCTGIR